VQEVGKRDRPGLAGDRSGHRQVSKPPTPPLVGQSNVVDVGVQGRQMKALLDTGSMVSTISKSMALQIGLPLQRVTGLVTVQGVGTQVLPYRGYVEADVKLTPNSYTVNPTSKPMTVAAGTLVASVGFAGVAHAEQVSASANTYDNFIAEDHRPAQAAEQVPKQVPEVPREKTVKEETRAGLNNTAEDLDAVGPDPGSVVTDRDESELKDIKTDERCTRARRYSARARGEGRT